VNNLKKIFLTIALILAASGLYYLIFYNEPNNFGEARIKAREFYLAGENQKVINVLEKEIKNATSKDAEASAKSVLAGAYMGVDYKKGVALLKEIVADESYAKIRRARAVAVMANLIILNSRSDNAFAREIFSGDPYSLFIDETIPQKINLGVRKLYEYSLQIYPLPYVEYRVAEWNVKQAAIAKLYNADIYPPTASIDFYILRAKDHLAKGDVLMVNFPFFDHETDKGYAYWVSGVVLGLLWELEKNDAYLKSAEEVFTKSISELVYAPRATKSYRTLHEVWTRFSYASLLYRAYGDKRAEDIKKLTNFIVVEKDNFRNDKSGRHLGLSAYLERIGRIGEAIRGHSRYDYDNALALAKINPNFKEFLKDLGWEI